MNIEWTSLKRPAASIFIILITGICVIAFLWFRFNATHANYLNAKKGYQNASARYHKAESEVNLFNKYKAKFYNYKQQGVIGLENRVSWAEVLQEQNIALSPPAFTVEINPRHVFHKAGTPTGIQWFKSTQRISASLLHEVDLLQILQSLQDHAEGWFRVSSCKLKRAAIISLTPQAKNVDVVCVLHWYSLQIMENS